MMNNNECILVLFSNQQKAVTGYLSWLKKSHQRDIENIVANGQEISVSWPDCEIVSSVKIMKKNIEKAKFQKYAAKILAHGKWVVIRAAEKLYDKGGVSKVTKSARKALKRKFYNFDNDASDTDHKNKTLKTNAKKSEKTISKQVTKKLFEETEEDNDSDDSQENFTKPKDSVDDEISDFENDDEKEKKDQKERENNDGNDATETVDNDTVDLTANPHTASPSKSNNPEDDTIVAALLKRLECMQNELDSLKSSGTTSSASKKSNHEPVTASSSNKENNNPNLVEASTSKIKCDAKASTSKTREDSETVQV
ncbi:hypothetical protein TSAR_015312 [Trichomalopsis sarcophagae]|uniref:Uncharacterized protein n=1 Tax=Trichomalopsis sarcophagae TaxID=543379 RepID=A0A232EDF7_9HYME|nr:hypothetical protein TSAR_015312 [Trichomalopsis sarcophagae]